MPLVCDNRRSGESDLWRDPVPSVEVESEKPWHRLAILLAAQGYTVGEIATKLERSQTWVSNLLRQDWARERLTTEINLAGRDEIATILKGAGPEALHRVIDISKSADSDAVKLAANKEILDRLLGKAVQVVDQKQKISLDLKEVDRELAALEAQERALGLVGDRRSPSEPPLSSDSSSKPLSDSLDVGKKKAEAEGRPILSSLPVLAEASPEYYIKAMDN